MGTALSMYATFGVHVYVGWCVCTSSKTLQLIEKTRLKSAPISKLVLQDTLYLSYRCFLRKSKKNPAITVPT